MAIKTDHIHTFDNEGNTTCCSLEQKINEKSKALHEHDHDHGTGRGAYVAAGISFLLLVLGLAFKHWIEADFFNGWIEIGWYAVAYLPVGVPVLRESWHALRSGELFTEFFLMSIATIGAFAIGEYPEGVAVMLFYAVGELFQSAAVSRAKNNIKALLDVRPKTASVWRNGIYSEVHPNAVAIGEKIQVRAGEHIPLDGRLLSEHAELNMAAISGESLPVSLVSKDTILAGSINQGQVIEIEVDKIYDNSSIARIIALVQDATSRKSKTELLIRRLAKIYTPIVVYLAIAIVAIPYFLVDDYNFSDWLYRALIFLVISCPCALVISIPLGYFGGLGAASKNGLLFKGATFLDRITKMNTLVMDKTGTVTKGIFKIVSIVVEEGRTEQDLMSRVVAIERKSTHPIAQAIAGYEGNVSEVPVAEVEEISGKGMVGRANDQKIVVGNKNLMAQFHIDLPSQLSKEAQTSIFVAIEGQYTGVIIIADELKPDAKTSISSIRNAGIKKVIMLSGDKDSTTQEVAKELGIDWAKGNLLPEDKLNEVEKIKMDPHAVVGFVGDGINDAPVLALSDIGFAMGDLGSDVAIETADVIIQTDQVSKIALAIKIGRSTRRIIYQNITLAFGVKALVLILGALGMATMWQAVFADVGVALLAILNAMRLQGMTWKASSN